MFKRWLKTLKLSKKRESGLNNFLKIFEKPLKEFLVNKQLLGVFLFVLGLLVFFFPSAYKQYLSFENKKISRQQELMTPPIASSSAVIDQGPIKPESDLLKQAYLPSEIPRKIIIPSLSMDLPVEPAKIAGDTWELSENTASFGLGSTPLGKIGNTVIFAHARRHLFGPLRNIKKADKVYVLSSDKWFVYEVKEIKTVFPSQIEVIAPTPEETLTLYTCSGFADTKRLIVVAKRMKAP